MIKNYANNKSHYQKKLSLLRKRIKWGLIHIGILKNPYIPNPLFADDVFLVSYPRSGNTWLRFMLAYFRYPEADINFKNISEFIPAGAESADSVWLAGHTIKPRIIKHHAQYQRKFPRVIYLVRDGRDVYTSYYSFLREKIGETSTLAEFIANSDLPFGSWSQHVNSWLNAELGQDHFLLIKYERLLQNPSKELIKIIGFCGLQYSTDKVSKAVSRATFENMHAIEKESGFPAQNEFSGKFVRKGKAGGWQNAFSENEIEAFKQHHNDALLRLGYEITRDW